MQYLLNEEEYKEYQKGLEDTRKVERLETDSKAWVEKNGCLVEDRKGTCFHCPLLVAGEGFGECFAGKIKYYSK